MGYQFKVAAWNVEFVKHMAEEMKEQLDNYYEDSMEFVDEDGDVNLREELAWDTCLERILEDEELGGLISTPDFEDLSSIVFDAFDNLYKNYFSNIESEILDDYKDMVSYNSDPLGYYGMKQSDFL